MIHILITVEEEAFYGYTPTRVQSQRQASLPRLRQRQQLSWGFAQVAIPFFSFSVYNDANNVTDIKLFLMLHRRQIFAWFMPANRNCIISVKHDCFECIPQIPVGVHVVISFIGAQTDVGSWADQSGWTSQSNMHNYGVGSLGPNSRLPETWIDGNSDSRRFWPALFIIAQLGNSLNKDHVSSQPKYVATGLFKIRLAQLRQEQNAECSWYYMSESNS